MGPSRIAGRYELQEQLGEGGMGVVWRALDTKTGGPVAIKLMKDISDPVAVDLFAKEWKALAEMCHPNIVDVRDVDFIEENRQKKPFFVMPLLQGATLAELIANASARLTPARIVEIMTQVCRGLQAAHQRGLVHRDLKPSNIFVMDDDTAKIIDFGVVHLAGSKSVTGQKGTFQYMSPEQAQLKLITPASDLFSLGAILYEALTLRRPFARPTIDETMQAVIHYMPPPVFEINPAINQLVSQVVHKCLAKQPIHRFSSARELSETLQKAFRNEAVFDRAKFEPRLERAKAALKTDEVFASEILGELEAEGHLDPRITVLRMQIDLAVKQKKIRQLLESARARMEQDEIALALDKLREALELDPQNPDALAMREAMEKQRHETQIAKWLELAHTHLGNRDFSAARNAVKEVLTIRPGDTRALDLLEKIESTEADARRIREQKELLYSSAVKAYQNGEIETALNKLERLFSVAQANPSAAVPERDAVYQSFYKEVRSERDIIHSGLEEAQRLFAEKNFAGAMAICRDLLARYPNDGTFHALKIRIEDAERQELSSYIAEISKRVETEPDLDRRANILREACERYPNEVQFAQQLKTVRERRDLVNSIVAKARQYEERGQHAEAISQWDILRNIHPQYPGIAIELEQCRKKRDRQAREEEQARLVDEIDGLIESRAHAKAIECADAALRDFPGDPELSGLRTLAEQALQRTKESRRLFEEGQRAIEEKDPIRATDLLRSSFHLDPRGPGLRDGLVNVLVDRARRVVDDNWREAEPYYEEASELDSNHPAVRGLRSTISEAKRQSFVGQCLSECRALVAASKSQEASERIRSARAEYPSDPRLEQYEASLQREVNEARRREERGRDRVALGENRRALDQNPDRARMAAVLEQSYAIRARHPDDPEIGQTVAEIEVTARRVAKVDDISELLRMPTLMTGTDGPAGAAVKAAPERPLDKKGPTLVDPRAEKTKIFPPPRPPKESQLQILIHRMEAFAQDVERRVLAFARPAGRWSETRLGAVAGVLVLIASVVYIASKPSVKPDNTRSGPEFMELTLLPADSTATVDGKAITAGKAEKDKTVEVTHLGYKTRQVHIREASDGKIALEPEPLHLSIQTSLTGGTVEVDGQKAGDLSDGSVPDYPMPTDNAIHKLTLLSNGTRELAIDFQAPPGARPQVSKLDSRDAFVLTTLGNRGTIYGGGQLKSVAIDGNRISIDPSGSDFTINERGSEIRFGDGPDEGSLAVAVSNAPQFVIHSLATPGLLTIKTPVERAILKMDGKLAPRQRGGWTFRGLIGTHSFEMMAEGYQPRTWQETLQRGKTLSHDISLTLIPVSTVASLVITAGTPGASLDVDGVRKGQLDENGNLTLRDVLPKGEHALTIAKAYHEPRVIPITSNPPKETRVPNVLLTPWATINFQSSVPNATVKYRRSDEAQPHETSISSKLQLPPGKYEIVGEAPGYLAYATEITVDQDSVNVLLPLKRPANYEFQDLNQVAQDGQWLKAKNPKTFVNLKPGLTRVNLIFARPGKTLFRDKKVEWMIELPQRHATVHYALEGPRLTRKVVIPEKPTATDQFVFDSLASGQAVSLHLRIDGSRLVIANDKSLALDDFTATGYDFSSGRISVRTDSQFLVRSE
jgi:eukaryotic-like serine/threonine-protein kinase